MSERYLFRLENDCTTLLVNLFGKYRDMHGSWSLVMIDPTINKFFRLRSVDQPIISSGQAR